ncbi:hypothetical protein A1O3_02647 [Capronia epimyces CBS 606.96]|uniref:Uncharacterized protein n=1 Tax=Capronia epimyces CBS 606.96 TaxID=1182542 RepID=W9YIS5_9EURO|nr:uncharacterized protein A1O3_02647 [Capronia epimyces CBS 606.96]EXJ89580.1 hypothetical protein A1O3_02647 [Capronia epimyces CBS 606.96]
MAPADFSSEEEILDQIDRITVQQEETAGEPSLEDSEELSDQDIEKLLLKPAKAKRLPAMSFRKDSECLNREPSLINYDADELQQRIKYAQKLGQRKVSPVTTAFATKYMIAAECALAAEKDAEVSQEEREALKRRVQELDYMLEVHRSLYYIPNTGMRYMLAQARKLERLQFLATYGDYFAITCKEVAAATRETEALKSHRSIFTRWWTEIQKTIRAEKEKQSQKDAPQLLTDYPTILAVSNCAAVLKIDEEQLFWTIEQYAERNATFHADIDLKLQQGTYPAGAEILCKDLKVVQQLNADREDKALLYVEALIQRLIEKWFTYDEGEEEMSDTWLPTELAKARKRKGAQKSSKFEETDEIVEFKKVTGRHVADDVDAFLEERAKWKEMISFKRKWSGQLKMAANKKHGMTRDSLELYENMQKFSRHMDALFIFPEDAQPEITLVQRPAKEDEHEVGT